MSNSKIKSETLLKNVNLLKFIKRNQMKLQGYKIKFN
jgi:hypothetical protein